MAKSIFHLLNRGVEKRNIFTSNRDYIRFIHNLHDFNNANNVVYSYNRRRNETLSEVRPPTEEIVDMLCWSLMPNHPHVLLVEKEDNNVGIFSKKVFGGYTMYFNEKNKRSGVLFQGRTKVIPIKTDAHFLHIPFYIHLNPLDLFQYNWKEDGVKNIKDAMKFLENYRWSNYRDIIGKGNGEFSDITNKELFFEMYDTNEKKYKKDLEEWITNYKVLKEFDKFE